MMIVEAIDQAVEKVLAESKRLRRAHYRDHTEEIWEAYRTARNRKARTIRKALQTAHREKVAAVSVSPEAL
jgi:hypothetical protein